jgi:hypothetical protein
MTADAGMLEHGNASAARRTGAADRDGGQAGWRELAWVACGYVLVSMLATWPLVRHFHTHAPGTDWWGPRRIFFETPTNLWNLWWFRYALVELHQDPFTCQYIFYPHGANLWLHTLAPLYGLIGLALQAVGSLAATLNAIVLLNLAAAGTVTHRLARELGVGRSAAFVAGGIYAFSPAVFAHLYAGHVELISTCWMPAALLFYLHLVDRPEARRRDAVALGLVLVGATYTCQYYVVYSIELLAVAVAVYARRGLRAPVLAKLGLAAFVALAGASPAAWSFIGAAGERADAASAVFFEYYAGDLASYVIPSFTNPLAAGPLRGLHERLRPAMLQLPQETTVFVGISVLGMALWGLMRGSGRGRPAVRALLVAVIVFWVLSLGSRLRVLGLETGLPLPASVLSTIPLLSLARAPGRYVIVAMLGLGILGAMGWERIERRWLRGLAIALLVLEYTAVPVPLFSTEAATVYERLRDAPGTFAVLEIPFGVRDGRTQLGAPDTTQIFAQTVHHHPIVTGMVSRLPQERWQDVASTPVIGSLLHPTGVTAVAFERDMRQGPRYFARWRIRAIVIHPQARGSAAQRYLERVLPVAQRESFADGAELLWLGR